MTTKRIEWEKDGSCWEIDGCTSRRLSGEGEYQERNVAYKNEEYNISIQKKVSNCDIRKPISLTITKEHKGINIYPDLKLDDNTWKYYEDLEKRDKNMIQIGAHLYYRQTNRDQFKFIGIVIEKKFGATSNLLDKNGGLIGCDYYILKIHSKKKSLGLGLCPNTIVPKIGEEHPKCIRLKKDGSTRNAITGGGSMRYKYDCCSNSGITKMHTSPVRGILY